jgi:hypothetical protein
MRRLPFTVRRSPFAVRRAGLGFGVQGSEFGRRLSVWAYRRLGGPELLTSGSCYHEPLTTSHSVDTDH